MVGIVEQAIEGTQLRIQTFYGRSDEEKPTGPDIAPGSLLIETDTHKRYMWDAEDGWGEW